MRKEKKVGQLIYHAVVSSVTVVIGITIHTNVVFHI